MLNVIVYGRNDNFNYELNKRTAIGLNQLAEHLDVTRDEIIFVDYNTHNDLPTHPEAIADALTEKTIRATRVIRVRPDFHAQQPRSGPPVREAVCRNIALRRVSQNCHWILSTNPDCALVSKQGHMLSQTLDSLHDGYFGLPRFELPRFVWEQLTRSDPAAARQEILTVSRALHLRERVAHYLPSVGYDAPGDFQLVRRADLVAIAGFDERMMQGWHVDANLNARLALAFEKSTDLNTAAHTDFELYHSEHTRRSTAKHMDGKAEDSYLEFVETVHDPVPQGQESSWGAPDATFEEFALASPPAKAILASLKTQFLPQTTPSAYIYGPQTHDCIALYNEHSSAFLVDHLVYLPPDSTIGFVSDDPADCERFGQLVRCLGFNNPIIMTSEESGLDAVLEGVDLLILETCGATRQDVSQECFTRWVRYERSRMRLGATPRKIIGLNVPHSSFEAPFLSQVQAPLTPIAARMRFGQVQAIDHEEIDLLGLFETQPIAEGAEGYIAICSMPRLPPSGWHLDFEIETGLNLGARLVLDIALCAKPVAHAELRKCLPGLQSGTLHFASGVDALFHGDFECRLWSDQKTHATIRSAKLKAIPDQSRAGARGS